MSGAGAALLPEIPGRLKGGPHIPSSGRIQLETGESTSGRARESLFITPR